MKRDVSVVLVEGDREYEVHRGTDAWRASMEWARFHGLDPMRIPEGSVVERDPINHRILYSSFVPTGPKPSDIEVVGHEPVVVDLIEQGERTLPFPPEVTR